MVRTFKKYSYTAAVLMTAMTTVSRAAIDFGPYSGAVTETSAVVVYRLESDSTPVRICYATNDSLNNPLYSPATASSTDRNNVVKVTLGNLQPATRYYYAPEVDGTVLHGYTGAFMTFPAGAADFTIAFGNSLITCRPEQSGMVAALENDPLFFLNTGDLFYADIAVNDLALFRSAYRDAFARECDSTMGAAVPLVFMWDDHDYGPNNSDGTAPGREASRQAFREHVPHYPLPAGNGDAAVYQAFSTGTVRFIMTDLRSERSKADRIMMGENQLQWFLNELTVSSATHDLIVWVSTVPYTTGEGASFDNWGGYSEERTTIANHISSNGIHNVMIISGDAHSLAAGDGSDADYADGGGAPLAEMMAAPFDNDNSNVKGGPWNQGSYCAPTGTNAYGLFSVHFTKDEIQVTYSGRTDSHEEKVSLQKTFTRTTSDVSAIYTGTATPPSIPTAGIYDINGRFVRTLPAASTPLTGLSSGLYFIMTPNGIQKRLKHTNTPAE